MNNLLTNNSLQSLIYFQKKYKLYYNEKIFIENSKNQTKKWRNNNNWYINGKKNECEIYQIKNIEKITHTLCKKTYYRLNTHTFIFIEKKYPYKNIDGFEWTENFDGLVEYNSKKYFFNLKFICEKGGSQLRTLKLVYDFIYCQLKYLEKNNTKNIVFINILDGKFSYDNIKQIKNVFKLFDKQLHKYIFIGDLYLFQLWWILYRF